jgi:hypothetical protein
MIFVKIGAIVSKSLKMRLTHLGRLSQHQLFNDSQLQTYDRPEVARILLLPESPLTQFQPEEGSGYHTALASPITLFRSVAFAWPDCHSRAMVIGDELAIRVNPCSYAPDGQGAMVAQLQLGR